MGRSLAGGEDRTHSHTAGQQPRLIPRSIETEWGKRRDNNIEGPFVSYDSFDPLQQLRETVITIYEEMVIVT